MTNNPRRVLLNLAGIQAFRDKFKVTVPVADSCHLNITRLVQHCTTVLNASNLFLELHRKLILSSLSFSIWLQLIFFLRNLNLRLRTNCKYLLRVERSGYKVFDDQLTQ